MKYPIVVLILFISFGSRAQHDFDSLYKADPNFHKQIDTSFLDKGFFDDHQPVLSLTISTNFKYLSKKKGTPKYQDAKMTIDINDSVKLNRNLQVKARGALRKSICYFPPLKLNFKKKQMLHEDLKEFDKIKLVRNCKGGKNYDEYVLIEYLIYKMYNILTDYSFRVRLLDVVYTDTGHRKKKSVNQFSFLIEPLDLLAQRLGAVPIEQKHIGAKYLQPNEENIMSVFQYMIGNTDWSIPGLHNMKIVKSRDFNQKEPVAIPYDFDYTGLIDAPYAIPSEKLPIEEVTERLFMGACQEDAQFQKTTELFKSKKEEIYDLFRNFQFLSDKTKKKNLMYLDQFYHLLDNEKSWKYTYSSSCKK